MLSILQFPFVRRKTLKPETPSTPTSAATGSSITTVATVTAGTDNAREMLVNIKNFSLKINEITNRLLLGHYGLRASVEIKQYWISTAE